MTWTETGNPVVVVPVGSCEQHGPHLPLDTDTAIATAIARTLTTRRNDCVVAPPLAITASGEHHGFPGTLSIGAEAMQAVVIELVRSADWAAGVVFVNGHGGNAAAMLAAREVLSSEGREVLMWWPRLPDGDLHAGHTETSILLAIAPEQVRFERAVAGPTPSLEALRRSGVQQLSESGVLGDPSDASAAHGRALLERLSDQLAEAVDEWVRS